MGTSTWIKDRFGTVTGSENPWFFEFLINSMLCDRIATVAHFAAAQHMEAEKG